VGRKRDNLRHSLCLPPRVHGRHQSRPIHIWVCKARMTGDDQRAHGTRDFGIQDLIWRAVGRRWAHSRRGMRTICPCLTMGSAGARYSGTPIWRTATHLCTLDRRHRRPRALRGRTPRRRIRSSSGSNSNRIELDGRNSTVTRDPRNSLTHLYHYNLSLSLSVVTASLFILVYTSATLRARCTPFKDYYLVFQDLVV